MSTRSIIDAFDRWRKTRDPLVMATVYVTEGSTYSKAGHRILIAANGDYQGLVSGGCLEGDLAEHAASVIEDGKSRTVTYDLRDDADDLWGMGVGCNGVIKILLQRLDAQTGYEPYQSIANCHLHSRPAVCATIIESGDSVIPLGATLVDWGNDFQSWEIPGINRTEIRRHCASMLGSGRARLVQHDAQTAPLTVLYAPVKPLPRLLILGAGPDTTPLVHMAEEIGWLVTVVDHRPAYLESGQFGSARRISTEPDQLKKATDLTKFSAAVVMSHHLATDRSYLSQLAHIDIAFLGILGPRDRRDRLIADLGDEGKIIKKKLIGPVGIDIGADSPESIALSILAQIHQRLSELER
jgi:xanthine/CO dehydrogenase XdhC/CoxF family maturation factor